MFYRQASIYVEYPVKVYNLHLLKEDDLELLKRLFYKEKKFETLREKVSFLREDIIKTGLEKLYPNVLCSGVLWPIMSRKQISSRLFLSRIKDNFKFLSKSHNKYMKKLNGKEIWMNDRLVAEGMMSKGFFDDWLRYVNVNRGGIYYCLFPTSGIGVLKWFVTLLLKYENKTDN